MYRSGGCGHGPPSSILAVKACCVLHNRCFEWGLHKLKPGQNQDPTLYGAPSVLHHDFMCKRGHNHSHISVSVLLCCLSVLLFCYGFAFVIFLFYFNFVLFLLLVLCHLVCFCCIVLWFKINVGVCACFVLSFVA